MKRLLPANYTVIYQIAGLSENELQLAIKDGVISADMTRADLEAWNAERNGRDTASRDEKDPIIATIRIPSDYDDDKKAQLEEALEKLKSDFGMAVERPRDPEAVAFNRMVREVDDYIRKGARQYLRKLKATRFAGKSHLSKVQRKKLWNYGDDEIEIRPDATWEQVQYALDTVGSGDQFERLRDEAFRLHGASQKAVKEHPEVDHDKVWMNFG